MLYGLYLSAMGLKAQDARHAVIANNLANVNTAGFKRDLAIMRTRANASFEDPAMAAFRGHPASDQGGGVLASSPGLDLSQGALQSTNNKTDLALDGAGFFTVQGDQPGSRLLTRDGRFIINPQGALVMANGGRAVLSAAGDPIVLRPDLPVTVDASGVISQGDTGQTLGIADVSDARRLRKLGGNLLTVDQPQSLTDKPAGTVVHQGQIEASGVDPVIETVNLIACQRAFDANARLITMQDQTLSQLNTIGRVA